jgi:hypothetical protein
MHEDLLSFSDTVVDELAQREQIFEDFRVVVPAHMDVLRGWVCRAGKRGGTRFGI